MYVTLNHPIFHLNTNNITRNHNKNHENKIQKNYIIHDKILKKYPKTSPTPLIIQKTHFPKTKLEALDNVINEIENSIKKRILIDTQIFASLLETCFHLKALEQGYRIHKLIPKNLLRQNIGISSKLMRLYAICGDIENAHKLFDEIPNRNDSAFCWNSLIGGYSERGFYEDALAIYFQMDEENVETDRFTFPRVLKACSGIGDVKVGEEIHRHVVRKGFWEDGFVLNALVDMYAKCGDIRKARRVFDRVLVRDVVCFNSMITGYIRHGLLNEALGIFRLMVEDGHEPDSIGISILLTGKLLLRVGGEIHAWVIRQGSEWDLSVANALMVFYSIHGKLEQACWIFNQMPKRDVVSWNSIISACSMKLEALNYFREMGSDGVLPDKVTFVSLLSACAHLGLVKEGERLFSLMRKKYGIVPVMEHYACIVNMYGRAGLIDKAYDVIVNMMEFKAGPTVWGALLYACCLHGNVDVGEVAAKSLFELEPDNEHNFELLMKIYVDKGNLKDAERVKLMMIERGLA